MEVIELYTASDMAATFEVLCELYPTLTLEAYLEELEFMVQHNYSQVVVKEQDVIVGVSGVWIGNKLWCGKYMGYRDWETDRKSTRLNSSHSAKSRMPSSA